MLSKNQSENRKQINMVCIDDLVPTNHILRDIEKAIDFSFIYDEVKDLYSEDSGRPSVDPVVLFKIVMIQYTSGIHSMRQTIKDIEVNMAYRWFLGYDIIVELKMPKLKDGKGQLKSYYTIETGENLPSRARKIVQANDVIVSSVEGSLQSCALIKETDSGSICSTGFIF